MRLRWLKRFLAALASFAAFVIVVTISLAALLWFKPELFLTESRLRQAREYLPSGIRADWRKLALHFEPIGWKGKRIILSAEGLTLAIDGTLELAVEKADIAVSMRWKTFRPKITHIDRIVVLLDQLTLKAGEAGAEEEPPGPLPDLRPPIFSDIFPDEVDFDLVREIELSAKAITIESREGPPLTGSAFLKKLSSSRAGIALRLEAKAAQAPGLKAGLEANINLDPQKPSLAAEAKARGNFAGWKGEFPFRLNWSDSIRLEGRPDLRSRPHHLDTAISLNWQPAGLEFRLGSFASNTIWKQGRLETHECLVKSQFDSARGYPKLTTLGCGLTARPKNRLIPTLHAEVAGRAELEPTGEDEFRATFRLNEKSADSFLLSRLDLTGALTLESGKIRNPEMNLELKAEIPKFQAWKEAWEGTPLAIPAPLHVMDGPLQLSVKSVITDAKLLSAEASFTTSLRSATQSFLTATAANLKIENPLEESRRIKVDAVAKLQDIRLEAPPLRLEEPPQFLPDKRFVTTKQAQEEAKEKAASVQARYPGVEWNLKIQSEQPVRIKTNLLAAELPVATDLALGSGAEMAGHIEIQPMPVNVFRKKTQLQKLRLTFTPGSKYAALDGRLDYRNPEVLIKILLLGNTESPRVEFQSEPPLSRQQIVAVLLFNKSLSELSEEEVSSTQNMSQALSDGALGLFSLFFLSSTPIQSVGYDPVTQSYSARVSLGGKTTFSVGSDFVETREFGLRRQLGGPWAIRTELRQELDRPDVVLTLLEWFKRF
jgi:hypothetical protein